MVGSPFDVEVCEVSIEVRDTCGICGTREGMRGSVPAPGRACGFVSHGFTLPVLDGRFDIENGTDTMVCRTCFQFFTSGMRIQ